MQDRQTPEVYWPGCFPGPDNYSYRVTLKLTKMFPQFFNKQQIIFYGHITVQDSYSDY